MLHALGHVLGFGLGVFILFGFACALARASRGRRDFRIGHDIRHYHEHHHHGDGCS